MPETAPAYFSPTLKKLRSIADSPAPEYHFPVPEAACTSCPASVWYADREGGLRCHCSMMHRVVWDGGMDPIIFCDGREQELAALAQRSAD